MNDFEFNAPQHKFDFNTDLDDSDGADTFFDVETDEPPKIFPNKENTPQDIYMSPVMDYEVKTPRSRSAKKRASDGVQNPSILQRSMIKAVRRLSNIKKEEVSSTVISETLSQDLRDKLSVKASRRSYFDGIAINVKPVKPHNMVTRSDQALKNPTLALRTRNVNKDEGPNRKRKAEIAHHDATKYMAMAERILHFQKDTPPRFHTSKRKSLGGKQENRQSLWNARKSYNPRRTIALTPKLMTTLRVRPVNVVSQQEKEQEELEELRKFQVKANPLNPKIFQSLKPLPKASKPNTIPEPFNLTQVFKKPAAPKAGEPYHFTANPVPKAILEKPVGVKPKPELPVTVPQSPAITKPKRVKVACINNKGEESTQSLSNFGVPYSKYTTGSTVVKPFSFETRDKQMLERKQQKIQEVLEAERKAREFKANPKPTFQPPKETNRSSRHLDSSRASSVASSFFSEDRDIYVPFKARSPRVLRKQPFKPVTAHVHSEPLNVQLHTDMRAKEREEFEIKQMQKEEYFTMIREEKEADKRKREEEELAKLRKETVHKAQPMPKYPPLKAKVHSGILLTEPKSPRFTKRSRANAYCTVTNDNCPAPEN